MERLANEFEAAWVNGMPCAPIIAQIIKLKDTCPKCKRTRDDWDCAEDDCPMAATKSTR